MRFLKRLVLGMLALTACGNAALFVLAFRCQWVPDSLAAGFSLAVPLELALSAFLRIMEDRNKNGNPLSEQKQNLHQPHDDSP